MTNAARILVGVDERPGAVILRLADGETLEVAPDAVAAGLPEVGEYLDEALLTSLREAAARKQVARRLLELLARRLDSRQRLHRKLCEQGFPPAAVEAVLEQAEARGLHSDRLFAAAYCRDALRARAVGRRWLEAKLRATGVSCEVATSIVAQELPLAEECDLAMQAAATRWRREHGRDERAVARVRRFLMTRGFPPAVAGTAARSRRPAD